LRLEEDVFRHFTAADDGVAMAAAGEVGGCGGYKGEGGEEARESMWGRRFKRRGAKA
jgi:hypothetical protein